MHGDFRGNFVGRVPSRGEKDVFEQAAKQSPTSENLGGFESNCESA